MADQDLVAIERANSVKMIGSEADGTETNPVGVSNNQEIYIRDTHDNGGLDATIALTTTPTEGKVGASRKTERKYVIMEALDNNIVWGFSNTSQSFDLFKSQLIMVPVGENTEIWFAMRNGTGNVAFGELS